LCVAGHPRARDSRRVSPQCVPAVRPRSSHRRRGARRYARLLSPRSPRVMRSLMLTPLWLGLASALWAQRPVVPAAPAAPTGPITLAEAIKRGRSQGVNATLAELGARAARARVGIQRAELLPNIGGSASVTPQT